MNQSPAQVARLFFYLLDFRFCSARFGASRPALRSFRFRLAPLYSLVMVPAALLQARPEVSLKTALPRRNEREYITPQAFRQLLFSTFFVERRGACARELVVFCSSQRRRRAAKFLEITCERNGVP